LLARNCAKCVKQLRNCRHGRAKQSCCAGSKDFRAGKSRNEWVSASRRFHITSTTPCALFRICFMADRIGAIHEWCHPTKNQRGNRSGSHRLPPETTLRRVGPSGRGVSFGLAGRVCKPPGRILEAEGGLGSDRKTRCLASGLAPAILNAKVRDAPDDCQ